MATRFARFGRVTASGWSSSGFRPEAERWSRWFTLDPTPGPSPYGRGELSPVMKAPLSRRERGGGEVKYLVAVLAFGLASPATAQVQHAVSSAPAVTDSV